MPDLRVGSTVWVFDSNRRVFQGGARRPDYRAMFVPRMITGETRQSWVIGSPWGRDIIRWPKRATAQERWRRCIYISHEEVDNRVWADRHRYRIAQLLGACDDIPLLRQVAAMLGYVEKDADE